MATKIIKKPKLKITLYLLKEDFVVNGLTIKKDVAIRYIEGISFIKDDKLHAKEESIICVPLSILEEQKIEKKKKLIKNRQSKIKIK